MTKVLVVTSSVREGRVADNILAFTKAQLETQSDFEVVVGDLKELPMPFFDAPLSPSDENFKATDENVIKWGKMVEEADAVVFLVAEYNHSYTPVLKNAIDWLYKEWAGKPVAFVGYGWVGGARAIAHLRGVMASNIGAKATETEANLAFMKQINVDGTILNEEESKAAVNGVFEELSAMLG